MAVRRLGVLASAAGRAGTEWLHDLFQPLLASKQHLASQKW